MECLVASFEERISTKSITFLHDVIKSLSGIALSVNLSISPDDDGGVDMDFLASFCHISTGAGL
jgi:hypothetical protein